MATKKTSKPSRPSKTSKTARASAAAKKKTTKTVRRKTAPKITKRPVSTPPAVCTEEMVAVAAYFRAERRGFAPGHELEDWLGAERLLTS